MKKKIAALLLIAVGISCSYAQMVSPFTPASRDENGKRVYVKPQTNYKRTSLSLSYGYGTVMMMNWYADARAQKLVGGESRTTDIKTGSGALMLTFGYELTPWLELDIPIVASFSKGYYTAQNPGNSLGNPVQDIWASLMPSIRINWLRNHWFSLYTKAGVGIGIFDRTIRFYESTTTPVLAWQVSPVGFEFGTGWFNFFVEGGYGFSGYATAGFKFKFGKNEKKEAGSGNWEHKYPSF